MEMELEDIKTALREVLREEERAATAPLAAKWVGGEVILQPRERDKAPKSFTIDSFLHKIVMIRDRLRVLEAKINSHPKLDDADRLELQQYITRIYGSLTTFNVLFRDKADHFVGERSEREGGSEGQ